MMILINSAIARVVSLYRLEPGLSTSSFGLSCAQEAGVRADVLQRAVEIKECLRSGSPISMKSNPASMRMLNLFREVAGWKTAGPEAIQRMRAAIAAAAQ